MSGFVADRSFPVPAGAIVKTGYAAVDQVRLKCRERMAVGDVDEAYRRLLQLGSACSFPPPNGIWDGETFEIADGRHEYVAALMLGRTHLLVAWMESAP